MNDKNLTIPEIGLIAITRVVLGAGIGFLLGDRLTGSQRRSTGWALFAVGALTSIPIVMGIRGKPEAAVERPLALVS